MKLSQLSNNLTIFLLCGVTSSAALASAFHCQVTQQRSFSATVLTENSLQTLDCGEADLDTDGGYSTNTAYLAKPGCDPLALAILNINGADPQNPGGELVQLKVLSGPSSARPDERSVLGENIFRAEGNLPNKFSLVLAWTHSSWVGPQTRFYYHASCMKK